MQQDLAACRALYDICFPDEGAFADALFLTYAPDCLRTIEIDGAVAAMLFSIPYPIVLENGTQSARYLYAVATHPDHRGKGLASRLLREEAARGPVFLRPMSPELFDFYKKVGFAPFSPLETLRGQASGQALPHLRALTAAEYASERARFAPRPTCAPDVDFLTLATKFGGAVAFGNTALALYETVGETVRFKEWWGTADLAPRVAGALGATAFELRRVSAGGVPFGVGVGVSEDTAFLAAMD